MNEIDIAIDHHRAGRLHQAELAYRAILAQDPFHIDAMHGLGVIALQAERPEHAVELISRAVELRPDSMAFQSNLGLAHQALRQYPEAETAFRRAIELAPDVAGPYFNLANLLKERGHFAGAVGLYLQAIQRQADHAAACNNLGNCYRELGRLEEASDSLTRAIQLRPDYAEAHLNLGTVLTNLGQPVEGEVHCRTALHLQPRLVAAEIGLGTALFSQHKNQEAIEAFRRAVELSPTLAEAHENLGLSLIDCGFLADGIASYRRAVRVAPTRPESWRHLGSSLMIQHRIAEADACFQRADELQPDDVTSLSQWLFWQLYRPEVTLASIAARHADWNARLQAQISKDAIPAGKQGMGTGRIHQSDGHRDRVLSGTENRSRLRIGFVSADFGQHPVGMFTIRTVEVLSSLGVDVVCYSTNRRTDPMNARFQKCATLWREVRHLPDDALADLIVGDQIDVLIDLAGHSAGNRLGTFARRPAPIQVTWIGSEGTTGLSAMDLLIADEQVVPYGAERFYSEWVVRMPASYVSWDPPSFAPVIGPLPSASGHPLTFGSFNNPAKYHPGIAELWSKILHQIPGSRLVLQYRHMTDQTLQGYMTSLFTERGIDATRLEFRDWQPYQELLGNYRDIDVALDPFPFGGGATTCDALWMGIPVVTLRGETFSSRHSSSYLSTVGLADMIADTEDDYVETAVALARDLERRQELRETLRMRIESSPLCDGDRCARDLVTILLGANSNSP